MALERYQFVFPVGLREGCALVFASEAKIEIEAKMLFRLEAKNWHDFAWFTSKHEGGNKRNEAKKSKCVEFLKPYRLIPLKSPLPGHFTVPLKGQCHEIFDFWFFSWISFPQAPEYTIRVVSNFFENSRRYSQLKVCHRCQRSISFCTRLWRGSVRRAPGRDEKHGAVSAGYRALQGIQPARQRSVAKFIVPDWGDKVISSKGLSYRPAGLCSLSPNF